MLEMVGNDIVSTVTNRMLTTTVRTRAERYSKWQKTEKRQIGYWVVKVWIICKSGMLLDGGFGGVSGGD
jgi:hypothetical protein